MHGDTLASRPSDGPARVRAWISAHMASVFPDVPMLFAAIFLLLAKDEAGITSIYWWGVWWGTFWLAPTCYITLWVVVRPASQRCVSTTLLPTLLIATLWVFEQQLGRRTFFPWWLTHALASASLFLLSHKLAPFASSPAVRNKTRFLILAASALPMVPMSRAQTLWLDSCKLRIGSSVPEAFEVLKRQYVLNPGSDRGEDRAPISAQVASEWTMYPSLTIGTAKLNSADVTYLTFQHGKLESFWISPD